MNRALDDILAQFALGAEPDAEARRAYEQFVADYRDTPDAAPEVVAFDLDEEA